jgi:hypothetical protein
MTASFEKVFGEECVVRVQHCKSALKEMSKEAAVQECLA